MPRHYDRIDFHYDRTYRGRIAYSALWSLGGCSRRWARCNRKPNCVKMPPHNPYQRCLYGAPDTPPEPPVERYSNGLSLRGGYYGKM